MLYSPNNYRHQFASLPHDYTPPNFSVHHEPPKKHHGLSWLFQILGFVIADVIVNIAFAVIDVVVGGLTGGAGDIPIVGAEATADEALFGAEATFETGEVAGNVGADAVKEGVKQAETYTARLTKKLIKASAKKFFGKSIRVDNTSFSTSIKGRFLKPLLQSIGAQATSGITFTNNEFAYNIKVLENVYGYLFNFLFVGSAYSKIFSHGFGRLTFNTFQRFVRNNKKTLPKEFKRAYRQIMKLLISKNDKELLKQFGGKIIKRQFGLAYLLKNYERMGLTDDEKETVIEFKNQLLTSNFVGYGKTYARMIRIYEKTFITSPKTSWGLQFRQIYTFFFRSSRINHSITDERFERAFQKFWKNEQKGTYFQQTQKEWMGTVEFQKAEKYARAKFVRRTGARRIKDYSGNTIYILSVERGVVAKLLSSVKSAERYIEYRLEHGNPRYGAWFKWKSPLQSYINYNYENTAGHYIDAFETYIFQFATSPFYAFDVLAFKLPRLLRINKLIRYFFHKAVVRRVEKEFGREFNEAEVKKFFQTIKNDEAFSNFIKKHYSLYTDRTITRERFLENIIRSEYRSEFLKHPGDISNDIWEKIKKFALSYKVVRKVLLIDENKEKDLLTEKQLLKRLQALPNFIKFTYSTILGVVIEKSFLIDNPSSKSIYKTKGSFGENTFFKRGIDNIAWTIFFSPIAKKAPITQSNVKIQIVQRFIKSGLRSTPYPWVFYNRYIAWGSLISQYGRNLLRNIARSLPNTVAPIRYYGMDTVSLVDTVQTHEYQKILSGKQLQPKQLYKVAAYGATKNILSLSRYNSALRGLRIASLGGTLGSSLVNSIYSNKVQESRLGHRFKKVLFYRKVRGVR